MAWLKDGHPMWMPKIAFEMLLTQRIPETLTILEGHVPQLLRGVGGHRESLTLRMVVKRRTVEELKCL